MGSNRRSAEKIRIFQNLVANSGTSWLLYISMSGRFNIIKIGSTMLHAWYDQAIRAAPDNLW